MFLVLFVLPQILLLGGGIADKTSFSMPSAVRQKAVSGWVYVDGLVTGEINGTVSGRMRANVDGEVRLNLLSGTATEENPRKEADGNETE